MSAYTPEQDELLAVIQTAHRESWDDATEYADAPHIIRAAVVRWLTEHDRQVAERAWDEGYDECVLDSIKPVQDPATENPYRETEQ